MPNIRQVSFTDPATVDLERIRRQQALAMQLQQQSEQPLASGTMAGGYFVPTSPLSHLAKALKGAQARRSMTESDEELKALGERQAGQRQMSLEQALRAARGTPATEASEDPAGNYMPGQAAVGPNPQGALDALMRSQDPGLQNVGLSQLMQQMQPRKPLVIGRSAIDPVTHQTVAVDPTVAQERGERIAAQKQELEQRHLNRLQELQMQNASREQMASEQRT